MDDFGEELKDHYGLEISELLELIMVIDQLSSLNVFDDKEMIEWESKPEEDQTWVDLKSFLGHHDAIKKCYGKNTARDQECESAAAVKEQASR